jgi:HPt (histidine-containing phosphotransfer) domain-containing protein
MAHMSLDLPKEHQLRYLNRRSIDIEELKAGLENDNFETARMIGHRLKGSGLTFGFPLITTIGTSIEQAGHSGNKQQIEEAIEKLSLCVQDYLALLSKE